MDKEPILLAFLGVCPPDYLIVEHDNCSDRKFSCSETALAVANASRIQNRPSLSSLSQRYNRVPMPDPSVAGLLRSGTNGRQMRAQERRVGRPSVGTPGVRTDDDASDGQHWRPVAWRACCADVLGAPPSPLSAPNPKTDANTKSPDSRFRTLLEVDLVHSV